MKLEKMHWMGIGIGLVFAVVSFFVTSERKMLYFLLVISLVVGSLPFLISLTLGQGRQREKEEKFLAFSRDLVESVKSRTPISKSILNVRKKSYGVLSDHIEKLACNRRSSSSGRSRAHWS